MSITHNKKVKNSTSETPKKFIQRLFQFFLILTRFWGIFTAIVLCGMGVDLTYHKNKTGYYIIGGSGLLLLLELTWLVTLFLPLCISEESKRVIHCWSIVTWLEGWKKSILYIPLGIIAFIWSQNFWISYVVSGQLISLSIFHVILSFRRDNVKKLNECLLREGEECSFDSKFEEVTEVLDDRLPEPIPGSSLALSDCLIEQTSNICNLGTI